MQALTREDRFEAIAAARAGELIAAADRILAGHEVAVLRPPVAASLMMRAIETAEGGVFNLGEVAVTEAEVELEGERGYCVVLGFEPAKALAGAVLDAACEAGLDADGAINATLVSVRRELAAAHKDEWSRLAATRVQFDRVPE